MSDVEETIKAIEKFDGPTSEKNQYLLFNVLSRLGNVEDKMIELIKTLNNNSKTWTLALISVVGLMCTTTLFFGGKITEQTWTTGGLIFLYPFYTDAIKTVVGYLLGKK